MVQRGVWDAIVQRIEQAGFSEAAQECESVLAELRELERQEIHNAISGEGFQAVWEQ